jgi:hypothetical protein
MRKCRRTGAARLPHGLTCSPYSMRLNPEQCTVALQKTFLVVTFLYAPMYDTAQSTELWLLMPQRKSGQTEWRI